MSDEKTPMNEAIQVQLAELRKTIECQREIQALRADLQKDLTAIRKDFSDLKTDFKTDSNFYKWVGVSGALVAIVLGVFGVKEWHDIIGKLNTNVEQTSNYQSDLAIGMGYLNGRSPQAAIGPLEKCYAQTPEKEEIAAALLNSYNEAEQWLKAEHLADEIAEKFPIKEIRDPWMLNDLGRAFLYEGQNDQKKLGKAGEYLEAAAEHLKGKHEERDIHENLWVYYLFKNEIPKAEEELKNGAKAKSSKGDWREELENAMDWSLFRYLAEGNTTMNANAKKTIAAVLK